MTRLRHLTGFARRMSGRRCLTILTLGSWLIAVVWGLVELTAYAGREGSLGQPPVSWPGESAIELATDRPTLLMVIHPLCPCSRASLEELDRLMARVEGRVAAHVLVWTPAAATDEWTRSPFEERARQIPGVKVVRVDDQEIARFGVATSGETLVYGAAGNLLFEGGITRARGHAGDNPGLDRLEALLRGAPADRATASVFGCAFAARPRAGGTP